MSQTESLFSPSRSPSLASPSGRQAPQRAAETGPGAGRAGVLSLPGAGAALGGDRGVAVVFTAAARAGGCRLRWLTAWPTDPASFARRLCDELLVSPGSLRLTSRGGAVLVLLRTDETGLVDLAAIENMPEAWLAEGLRRIAA